MKLISFALAAIATCASLTANASVVQVGALTRADGSSYIVDTLNSRQWLGFDVTKGRSYAQTVEAIQTGGEFAGYKIARNADAQLFVNAMGIDQYIFCGSSEYDYCFPTSPDAEHLVGESYSDLRTYGFDHDVEYALFLSDNGVGEEAGYIQVYTEQAVSHIAKGDEFMSIEVADQFYSPTEMAVGWLLYRDIGSEVPEPGTLALAGLGLLAAYGARRRKIRK